MTQAERLNFLINALIEENEQYKNIVIPADVSGRKQLLRALMNVRPPKSAPQEFLSVQDEYLKAAIAEKGITDGDALPFLQDKISLWQGDITTLKCGAIVNAANSAMLGCFVPCHGCIDNAIHTYAGIQLRGECDRLMRAQGREESVGYAKLTRAYNLPCSYVIHTVGPYIQGKLKTADCAKLKSCYLACLRLAEEYNISSLTFCCISTGVFRFPPYKAAEIAINTVKDYLAASAIKRVIFNVFTDADKNIYEDILSRK